MPRLAKDYKAALIDCGVMPIRAENGLSPASSNIVSSAFSGAALRWSRSCRYASALMGAAFLWTASVKA